MSMYAYIDISEGDKLSNFFDDISTNMLSKLVNYVNRKFILRYLLKVGLYSLNPLSLIS